MLTFFGARLQIRPTYAIGEKGVACKNDLVFDVKANTFQGVSGRGDRLQRNSANGKSSTWCYFLIAELHFVGRGQKQRSLKTLCYLSGTGKDRKSTRLNSSN